MCRGKELLCLLRPLLRRFFLTVRQGMVSIRHSFRMAQNLCVDHVHHPFNGHVVSREGPSLFSGPLSPRSRRVPRRSAGGSEALCRGIQTKCRRRHGLGSNDWREQWQFLPQGVEATTCQSTRPHPSSASGWPDFQFGGEGVLPQRSFRS